MHGVLERISADSLCHVCDVQLSVRVPEFHVSEAFVRCQGGPAYAPTRPNQNFTQGFRPERVYAQVRYHALTMNSCPHPRGK